MAFKFDGVGDFISFGDVHNFTRSDTFSFLVWVKSAGAPGGNNDTIFAKYGTGNSGYYMRVRLIATIEVLLGDKDTNFIFKLTNNTLDTAWHHIALTYSGNSAASGAKIYIDGVEATYSSSNGTLTGTEMATTANLQIGQNGQNIEPLNGVLDDFSVWNRVLSVQEIKTYASKRVAGNENGLVGYWRLDDNAATPSAISFIQGNNNGTVTNAVNADSAPINYGHFSVPAFLAAAAYTKTLAEVVTVVDTLTRFPKRTLSEILTIVDSIRRTISRTLSEVVTIIDSIVSSKIITKILTETITIVDTVLKIPGKVFSEVITIADTLTRLTSKTFSEVIAIADTIAKQISRVFSEVITIGDSIKNLLNGILTNLFTKETKPTTSFTREDKPQDK